LRRAELGRIAGYDPAAEGSLLLEDRPLPLVEDPVEALAPEGVAVDFSHPDATRLLVQLVRQKHARLVIGTTGQSPAQLAELHAAAEKSPVVRAPNFSLGLNRILQILPYFAVLVQDGFDVECVEAHHRTKRDAPSGTAGALLAALGGGSAERVHGRH